MTMRRPFTASVVAASLLVGGVAHAQFGGTASNKELEARANQTDSRLGALVRVVLPLVAPGLAATAVFCLIGVTPASAQARTVAATSAVRLSPSPPRRRARWRGGSAP